MLTVGSLFSGIGGIDLGLERAGMSTRWFVEWDRHCQNVLRRHWPGVPVYGDIQTVDWSTVERVDVLAGGFPCQPVSNAGKRLGTADHRWLWPEFARAIRELRPRYVLVENVAALLHRGFGEVVTDLAALGYDAEWDCIPASAVGAPHRRDRLWIVAFPHGERQQQPEGSVGQVGRRTSDSGQDLADADPQGRRVTGEGDARRERNTGRDTAGCGRSEVAHSDRSGRHEGDETDTPGGPTRQPDRPSVPHPIFAGLEGPERGVVALAEYRRSNSDPAGSGWWATEPNLGRVADGIPHRVDRLRSLGNAVVPQIPEWIGRAIVAHAEGS